MADQTMVQQKILKSDVKKSVKIQNFPVQQQQHLADAISRERSFVRQNTIQQQQNANKRRSSILHSQQHQQQQRHQIRGKPAMEIYRPPSICF